METQYGIENPLRLYENRLHQNQNRDNANERAFKLYCPLNYLLPFQIKRLAGVRDITSIRLVNNDTGVGVEILDKLESSELDKLSFENFDYLIHYGQEPHAATVTEGDYFIEVSDNTSKWFSEVITFVDFDKDNIVGSCIKTKIEYWDRYNVGDIFYRSYQFANKQYKNVMYLDIAVGRPKWDFEIEGDTDGDGQLVPDTITREKEYLLQGVFPEFFIDALSMLPLHQSLNSKIAITTEYGYTAEINRVDLGEPEWIDGDGGDGRVAKIDLNFVTVTQIKSNCATALEPLTSCVRSSHSYETLLLEGSTHFNNGTFVDGLTTKSITHGAIVMIEYLTGLVDVKTFDSTNNGTPESMYKSTFVVHTKGDVYTNRNLPILTDEPYLFYGGSGVGFLTDPVLTFVGISTIGGVGGGATGGFGLPRIKGIVITNSLVELWKKDPNGGADEYVQDLKPELVNGSGAAASVFNGDTYYLKMIGLNCDLGISNEKTF